MCSCKTVQSNFLKLVDVIMSKYGEVRGLRRKAYFRRQKLSKNRQTVLKCLVRKYLICCVRYLT